jgi:tRNA 2-thiouridine synthesizing protein E
MPSLPERDAQGFLIDLSAWNEEIARAVALEENIELTSEHWEIIYLLRDFHREFDLTPPMRILVKTVAARLGGEKGQSIHLLKLFPGSPARLAAKIAGLPKPNHCL